MSKTPSRGRATDTTNDVNGATEDVRTAKAKGRSTGGNAKRTDAPSPSGPKCNPRGHKPEPKPGASDYEVGRCKPPRHTRFAKGRSGNPGGRRKGSVNVQTILAAVAATEIEISDQGRRQKVPLLTAIFLRVGKEAVSGDMRAALGFIDRCAIHLPRQADDEGDIGSDDKEVIDRYMDRERPGGAAVDDDESFDRRNRGRSRTGAVGDDDGVHRDDDE